MLQAAQQKTKRKVANPLGKFVNEVTKLQDENKELKEVAKLQAEVIRLLEGQKKILLDCCGIKLPKTK